MATSAMVPSLPTVMCATSLEEKAMSEEEVKPRPDADATTSLMDVPSSNATLTTKRSAAPTAPVTVSGDEGVVRDATCAAESRTEAACVVESVENVPVMVAVPGDKPMTTLPEVEATGVALDTKFVLPVTSYVDESVRRTTALARTRW